MAEQAPATFLSLRNVSGELLPTDLGCGPFDLLWNGQAARFELTRSTTCMATASSACRRSSHSNHFLSPRRRRADVHTDGVLAR